MNAFTSGIRDPQTAFFVKARNPTQLNKAISDALEVTPVQATEQNVLFTSFRGNNYGHRGHWRGRGRGYFNNRNQTNESNRSYGNRGGYRNRGGYGTGGGNGNRNGYGNRGDYNNQNNFNNQGNQNRFRENDGSNRHTRGARGHANLAASQAAPENTSTQPEDQEANLIDLFR